MEYFQNINKNNNSNEIMIEMIKKQLTCVRNDKKLQLGDIKRICKNIDGSIFGEKCNLWNGLNVKKKYTYINFYFKQKKTALHRLLYINYVENIKNNEYIRYTCENPGICCNINHLKKFKYKNKKKTKK